jgi:hypothetical protein
VPHQKVNGPGVGHAVGEQTGPLLKGADGRSEIFAGWLAGGGEQSSEGRLVHRWRRLGEADQAADGGAYHAEQSSGGHASRIGRAAVSDIGLR